QTFQEQAGIRRHTLLCEQRTYPFLDLAKRRRPQRKRLLNRRCLRPRPQNHGYPWIQTPPKNATVMLEEAFHEDLAIIEAQQKVFDADPNYQLLAIGADAALTYFRWVLARRIEAEGNTARAA